MITVLAPIPFLGSFALAAPALESSFQEHGESLGPILRDVDFTYAARSSRGEE